jgi:hypothetical protein
MIEKISIEDVFSQLTVSSEVSRFLGFNPDGTMQKAVNNFLKNTKSNHTLTSKSPLVITMPLASFAIIIYDYGKQSILLYKDSSTSVHTVVNKISGNITIRATDNDTVTLSITNPGLSYGMTVNVMS